MTGDPRRLLIVNPNTDTRVTGFLAAEARRAAGEGLEIVAVNAASGLAAIETPQQVEEAARAVEAAIVAGRGAAAAIIGAFGDPGLREARARALMPVVGLGEAGMREAGREGRRFAIVTLGAAMERPILERARAMGLADGLTQVRILPFSIGELVDGRDAAHRVSGNDDGAGQPSGAVPLPNPPAQRGTGILRPALHQAILAAIDACEADAVLLGGAPFAGLGREFAERTGRVALDGVEAAVRAAMSTRR